MRRDADDHPCPQAAFAEAHLLDGGVSAVVEREYARALCAGHFPGDPVLPGAYLAALMADLAGRLAREPLAEVVRCVFRVRVRPDDEIVVAAWLAPAGSVEAEVRVRGACAARATLRFEGCR
jgi:3-hydroxymyristoyl/3-hydroxydecanoyl-(acyl carrier protein) dehydratase